MKYAPVITSAWLLLACPVVATAQSVMEPKHVAQLAPVIAAEISPNGEYIAYILSVPRQPLVDDDGTSHTHLHVVDRKGNSRPYVTGKDSVNSPQWSHDSKYIYYLAQRGDDKQTSLYRIPVDGGESAKVLSHATSISGFSLSPDDKQIAFLAKEEVASDRKQLRDQGFSLEIFEEDWQNTRVWIAKVEDNESEQVKPRMLDLDGSASHIAWSDSGRELAVVLAPTPSVDDSYMAKQVSLVDAGTGTTLFKVPHRAKLGDVQISPDGKHIAMIAGVDLHDPADGRLLIASTATDEAPRDLMPDYAAHVTSFVWQSDSTLVWTADEGTLTRVGSVTLDGDVTTLLEPSHAQILSSISLDAEGTYASLLGHARDHYSEVFGLELESRDLERLTISNPWLKDLEFARQETITWVAEDGLELEGVLIYPLNYIEGRRYPLIMSVHGGPEAHESDGWLTTYSRPGQVAAARGFFVFYPNYRGSTGKGVDFSKMGQADAAGKEFSDLIDGIDQLADEGLVDKARVGITGASYGGYASAWGATYYSDRFAASVMFVGISDNLSKVGTTDIPEEMFLVHHRKRLWDDWDYFLQSSPIRHIEKNRTPTLILHGKDDPRVHPSQSLEFHRHLKTLGQAPVRLVLYEGEGHGNRKAASRLDYNLRLLRWMEHFLLGDNDELPEFDLDYRAALGLPAEEQ